MYRVFISVSGENQNIGDVIIRRLALEWVRGPAGVRAYVGVAQPEWLTQVGLTPADVVIEGRRSLVRWLAPIGFGRARPALVLDPGEVTLSRWYFPQQLVLLLAAVVVRLRRGVVILPPRAVTRRSEARPWSPTVRLHRAMCATATVCLWRDQESRELVGTGDVVPDIAFGEDVRAGRPVEERRTLMVSLRGKPPAPDDRWVQAVSTFAREHDLAVVTFAQVEGDDPRARALAEQLGAAHVPWSADMAVHEQALRDLYDQARLVISDRLHVLILASLSGAVPVEMVANPTAKIRTHFATIGLGRVSADARERRAPELVEHLEAALRDGDTVVASVADAHERVVEQRDRVHRLLAGDPVRAR